MNPSDPGNDFVQPNQGYSMWPRLFDETQRLLKETEQRAAEMAVINSIQQGMAGSLDFQGIVELVGAKLAEATEADWAELDAAFAANKDPLTGHEPEDGYRPLFRQILNTAPAPKIMLSMARRLTASVLRC